MFFLLIDICGVKLSLPWKSSGLCKSCYEQSILVISPVVQGHFYLVGHDVVLQMEIPVFREGRT